MFEAYFLLLIAPLEELSTSSFLSEEESPLDASCHVEEESHSQSVHFPLTVDERYVPLSLPPEQVQNLPPFLPMEEEEEQDEEGNESICAQSSGAGSLSVIPIHYSLLRGIEQEPLSLFADRSTTAL